MATSFEFPTTHWTLVQQVRSDDPERASAALDEICRAYWFPIYSYLRMRGHVKADAEDLTQTFFAHLVDQEALNAAREERGRLRSFLLGTLRRVVSDELRFKSAQKRGGNIPHVPLDEVAETWFQSIHAAAPVDPEAAYERAWAHQVIESVFSQLRNAFEGRGKAALFADLDKILRQAPDKPSSADLARCHGVSEAGARQMVHRVREKFRTLLQEHVARTVMDPADVSTELMWIQSVVSGR